MSKNTRKPKSMGFVFWAAAATLTCPFLANAQSIVYECNLSGGASGDLSGCAGSSTGGYRTSTASVKGSGLCFGSDYCGANSNTSSAVSPIDAWNVCRWVDNTSGKDVFIPFKTSNEWNTFLSHLPTFITGGGINLSHCAVPYTVNGAPSTTTIMPPFAGCTTITGDNPNVYGRTGVSLYPDPAAAGPNFTCHAGTTTMMSLAQWKAGDRDSTPNGTLTWANNYQYSPDISLAPSSVVVDQGTPVTINWAITPFRPGAAVSCSVSPGGWGPDSSGQPRTGSSSVIMAADTTFTLTCTTAPSLTSVATTTVTANPPPPPPCCSGDGGGDGGGGGG